MTLQLTLDEAAVVEEGAWVRVEAPPHVPAAAAWTPVGCAVPGCGVQAHKWSGLHRASLCDDHAELPHRELLAVLPAPPLDTPGAGG